MSRITVYNPLHRERSVVFGYDPALQEYFWQLWGTDEPGDTSENHGHRTASDLREALVALKVWNALPIDLQSLIAFDLDPGQSCEGGIDHIALPVYIPASYERRTMLEVDLPDRAWQDLEALANESETSVEDLLEQAIDVFLKSNPHPHKS